MEVAKTRMIRGMVCCLGGIAVTTLSFISAAKGNSGGMYIIAWGAIIFGGEQFFHGYLYRWSRKQGPRRQQTSTAQGLEEN